MQKIIDSHFHFWKQQDLPWLTGPMVPRIFGPYEALRRDYPITEFLSDLAGSGIEKAVYIQVNWAKERFEDEVAWVQKTADETGWPHAIVGYADMTVDDVRPQLDRLKRYRLVRGIAPSADQVLDPKVRANVRRLKDYGFSFDLQIFPSQMCDGAQLVGENPETDFILQHTGMLTDSSPETTAAWQAGLTQLATMPNLYSKLSAFGTFVHRNDPALISYIVDNAIKIFGSERLLFGSNFPIEKLWTGHAALMQAHRDAVAKHGETHEANIFWNTAARVYRI